jgi:hypothetical protein
MICEACHEVDMIHCSDPFNCGGPWDNKHPHLIHRADGVKGHFAIGKTVGDHSVFWNEGVWAPYGQVYTDYDAAICALSSIPREDH